MLLPTEPAAGIPTACQNAVDSSASMSLEVPNDFETLINGAVQRSRQRWCLEGAGGSSKS